jgi:four helix bundle protein
MDRKILEKRLITYSSSVIALCRKCEFDSYTQHLGKQIVRSGSSAALNYGEAQSAESRADFMHKLSIVLKELRETFINLSLIQQSGICKDQESLYGLLVENNELISIFQKSINTLQNGARKVE